MQKYAADMSLFKYFGLDKSNIMCPDVQLSKPFSKPQFMPHHLFQSTKSYPCISLTFRRAQRSFRVNRSAKKVHLWTEQLGTKVSFSDNVPHRLYLQYRWTRPVESLSFFFFFLITDPLSMESHL